MNVGISFSVGRLTECFRPLHGVLPVNKKSIVGSSLGTQRNRATLWFYERECQEKIFLPRAEVRRGLVLGIQPPATRCASAW